MEALATYTQPFFAWLLETTLIAGMVICLILAAQKLLGHRLGPRWCHALWLVLLLRMVLPWTPPSPVSLLNLVPASIQRQQPPANVHAVGPEDRSEPVEASQATEPKTTAATRPIEGATSVSRSDGVTEANDPSASVLGAVRPILPWLWLAGAVVLGSYLLAGNFALWRIVKREHPLVNQQILELFETCKAQMGVQTIVALVPNDQVKTAALFGFLRPRLLLPREMIETTSAEELRYIFLHELAHLKRHDIYLGWLASLLQVLHWFNPLIWLAFHQMRADRELACDALVLTRTHRAESHQYGQTIVALLGRFSQSRPLPAMAGILESQSQLKRRITMIARFESNSYRWSPLATTLIVLLACVALPKPACTRASVHVNTGLEAVSAVAVLGEVAGDASKTGCLKQELTIDWNEDATDFCLSRDGNTLAYSKRGERKYNIVVRNLTSGEETEVAEHKTGNTCVPVLSPDGQQLVYTYWANTGTGNLHIISLGTGEDRTLDYEGVTCDWSRDGCLILVDAGSWLKDRRTISLVPAGGGAATKLNLPLTSETDGFRFSPDAKYVSYSERGNLYVYSVDGGEVTQIGRVSNDCSQPLWSPDGKTLLFLTHWGFGPELDLCGVPIVNGEAGMGIRVFKPDLGEEVKLFSLSEAGRLLYSLTLTDSHIFYTPIDPETGQPAQEPVKLADGRQGRWSPDGKRIAYVANEVLHVMSADRRNDQEIVRVDRSLRPGTYAWAPDNDIIYIPQNQDPEFRESRMGIYAVSVSTREKRPVLLGGTLEITEHLTCSPDGKYVAFPRRPSSSEKSEICMVDVNGENLRQLTFDQSANKYYPAWSPDGTRIAFEAGLGKGIRALVVVSVHDGTTSEIFRGNAAEDRFFGACWSPNGTRIAWASWSSMRIGQVSDGKWLTFNVGMDGAGSPHWSLDGTKMLFSTHANLKQLVLMDNFLPRAEGK